MANERVQYDINDLGQAQLAPSQSARTNFTPGKASALPLDQNWPTDFRIPTGMPQEAGFAPIAVTRVRVVKLGRNIVSDQVLVSVPANPEDTTQENDGRKERTAGYDWADV